MASKRDLKKDINNVLGDIIEAVFIWEIANGKKPTKESESIIDDAIATFDELIARANARDIEEPKAHYQQIRNDLDSCSSSSTCCNNYSWFNDVE